MREHFSEFYAPTQEQFEALWADGLIVLDANVLLDLYRTPTDARGQFLELLEKVKDRLWIPYQAGLEFHRNRAKVISDKGKNISEILSTAAKSFADIRGDVTALDIDKYGLGIESRPLLEELEQVQEKLSETIGKVHVAQLEMAKSDPIQEKLFDLYAEKVGSGPKDQAELNSLIADGEKRYEDKIPPGYEDHGKSKNPNDAYFFHNGIKYERQFGDLIFWRQIMSHAKKIKVDKIILVSSEKKEDWWRVLDGKRFGPHPELIQEIRREAGVSIFWMYPPDQFMKYAGQQANVTVSETALEEVRNAGASQSRPAVQNNAGLDSLDLDDFLGDSSGALVQLDDESTIFTHASRDAVHRWLQQFFFDAEREVFPDVVIEESGSRVGFEVVPVMNFSDNDLVSHIINVSSTIIRFTKDERLKKLYLVVAADSEAYNHRFDKVGSKMRTILLRTMLRKALSATKVDGIFFGLKHSRSFSLLMFVPRADANVSEDAVARTLALDAR